MGTFVQVLLALNEKEAVGGVATVTNWLNVAAPQLLVTVSVTAYTPSAVYECVGFVAVLVLSALSESPKSHKKDWLFWELLANTTLFALTAAEKLAVGSGNTVMKPVWIMVSLPAALEAVKIAE